MWSFTRNLRRATLVAATLGREIGFLFILFGAWQLLTGNVDNGLWIAFIGWFLENAAMGQVWQQQVASLPAGHKVSEAMSRSCVTVSEEITIQQLIDRHILGQGQRCMVVARGEETTGLLTLHHIRGVPRENWTTVTVGEARTPLEQMRWVPPEKELQQALGEMDRDGVNQLPVMEGGSILGMLSREDVISYLRTLQALRA